jgi:hypothetical protein
MIEMMESYLKTHIKIEGKEELMKHIEVIRLNDFAPTEVTGLVYLDVDMLQKLFKPHFDALNIKLKITRGWAHFMGKGAIRRVHEHTTMTGLYYLHIPKNSAKMWFDDTDELIEPIEGDFILFDAMRPHGITEHKNDELRWAIAFECELIKS